MAVPTLSTGLTLLNLGVCGKTNVAFRPGDYVHIVGDSSTGKSWIAGQILAEAANNEFFDGYDLIDDDIENGMSMDIEKFFGAKLAKRIKPPAGTRKDPEYSTTIEELYDNIDNAHERGKPFIYIVDSMDGLTTEDDEGKFQEEKKARGKGKEVAGSFGTSKARKNSTNLRSIVRKKLKATGSILIIISQTRDNIGFGFEKKTRSGGKALHFYAHLSIWTSIVKTLKKPVGKKQHTVGHTIRFDIKKNRVSGRYAKMDIDFLYDYGFDDTGSMVRFLTEEGVLSKGNTQAIGLQCKLTELPAMVEEAGQLPALKKLTRSKWRAIEELLKTGRKPKYA